MCGDGKKCGYPLTAQCGANVEKTALQNPECHEASGIKRKCRIAEQQDTTVTDQIEWGYRNKERFKVVVTFHYGRLNMEL